MSPLRGESLFFAIPVSLLCMLVISRALVTGLAVQFLIAPMHALPLLIKTSFQDFLYVAILSLIFAPFYFAGKSRPKTLLYIFGAFALLSIMIGMINIQVTALLGRPFNYQWLYYSDFLQSSDASRAIGSNLDSKPLAALFLMMLAAIPLLALLYHALNKKPAWIILLVIGCVSLGYFATGEQAIAPQKTKNPVFYFVRSLFQGDGMSILSAKKDNEQPAFLTNNKNIVEARYSQAFGKAKVKNVVVLVLESTPAEYVTVYNPKYETMPYLNSIRSSALIFDEVYAHAPATNKSMASLLCSVYPYLSYKSVTAERPDIDWPSLPSELNKAGYRTAFFNSGDNRFQGAENFLQNRGFGRIEDYRQNTCAVPTFSDSRYANENLRRDQ
jgi:phosphoglycerol transferase MdoB-like AlkP superfamily enzyme